MKIDRPIRDAYAEQYRLNAQIREEVDRICLSSRDKGWRYESRLESEESFALKVEAGIYEGNLMIDDFLGCVLVVRNGTEIAEALNFVGKASAVSHQRPADRSVTSRDPWDFRFDELRVYARLRPSEFLPPREVDEVVFEIQIKTYLQHAWGIATHDLTYKTDSVSWAKARIAHQLRAMLEHAEVSIEQVARLSESPLIMNREYFAFVRISSIIALLREHWLQEQLPRDLHRLAKNVDLVLQATKVELSELSEMLATEANAGRGALLTNLSPYGTILQTLVNLAPERVARAKAPKRALPISREVEIPPAVGRLNARVFKSFDVRSLA